MWSRSSFIAALALVAAPALAQVVSGEAPRSREEANAILDAARRDSAEIDSQYQIALRDCERDFFVNPCRQRALKERDQRRRALREREVAARETLRRLDAEERARVREQKSAEVPARAGEPRPEAGERVKPEPKAPRSEIKPAAPEAEHEAAKAARDKEAEQRRQQAESRATTQAAERERKQSERAAKDADSAASVERYERRQREAQARAEEKSKAAEQNKARRDKRQAERERAAEEARKPATP